MIIIENDFKIVKEDDNYILYTLKTKKEFSEDSNSKFRVYGYYSTIFGAMKYALFQRKDKKYPGKEPIEELQILVDKLLKDKETLDKIALSIHNPILDLKNELNLKLKND